MASRFEDLVGTLSSKFLFGLGGVQGKSVSGKFRARNTADSADAPIVGSVIAASGDSLQLNEDAANSGADWPYNLARPASGMTAARTVTFPAGAPSPNQALTDDGSGTGALVWTTVAAGTDKAVVDTTSLAFGTTSPLTLFTLPANAVVLQVTVIIDTAFNGTPSLSIGISGTTSKYMASTQVDLTMAAATAFEVSPSLASVGSTEALIATYSAGSASAGAARILIAYVIPS